MQLAARTLIATTASIFTLVFATPALATNAGGGGMATCVDATDSCQVCSDEQCHDDTQACCDAVGCYDLVLCLLDNCADSLTDVTALQSCAATNCLNEVLAAGGLNGPGVAAAQTLGTCVGSALQNPPAGACDTCVNGFGGAGGMAGQGGGPATTTGAGGGTTLTGGNAGVGGAVGAGGAATSTGSGLDTTATEDDGGCGCRVVGVPMKRTAPWAALFGLAGLVASRRRRRQR